MIGLARATMRVVSDEVPHLRAAQPPARDEAPIPLKAVRNQPAGTRPHADVPDEALLAATLRGERWAQREVWYRFAPMVYGLLRRSLSSRHDTDDLVQEVFLRVFRRMGSIEKASALRSFIYSIGVRVVSEEIRHFQVVERAHSQLVLDSPEPQATDFEARDTLWRVQGLLDGMKDKHRAVFVLRHVEGMQLQEISAGLGLSLASVKRYLVSALRSIQHAVASDHELQETLGLAAHPARGEGKP